MDTLLQDYKLRVMQQYGGNRWRKMVYRYVLVSGKVNHVAYQPGNPDAFYHRYSYDAENKIATLSVDLTLVTKQIEKETAEITQIEKLLVKHPAQNVQQTEPSLYSQVENLVKTRVGLEKELEKPFKDWNDFQNQLKAFELRKNEVIGSEKDDATIKFYEKELLYLDKQLQSDIENIRDVRNSIVKEIYQQKEKIQAIYNKMKAAISNILAEYSAEQNITIATSFKVDKSFYVKFFDYVNRYGHFYDGGDEELKKITQSFDFNDHNGILEFISALQRLDIRFKEARQLDFYNFICSLDYIRSEYDLRLNGKSLQQLSPGEKGGLLLIFYLVLDKDNKPLIIDQPEDNLDNQSVAEILVPYIKNAKKMRQIIMITHNPNLAIVADAEQIIYMDINKEGDYLVSCDSGSIENPRINHHIVNILEGKMKSFNNRKIKYRPENRLQN